MGQLLGTYYKLRRRNFIHMAVWAVLLILSLFLTPFVILDKSGVGVFLDNIAELTVLIAGIVILVNVLGILFSTDTYLDIYENGFQIRRTGIGLMMWRNGTITYTWNVLGSYRMTTKNLHNSQRYLGSPDPISGIIIKLLTRIFTQSTDGVELSLTILFSMTDGNNFSFTDYRGLRDFTKPILPERIKPKRRENI